MLRSLNNLEKFAIGAADNEIGRVDSFLFDESSWAIRYLVGNTGKWLSGRKVLIAATALGEPNWQDHAFPVGMTKEQVKNAPGIDVDKPVSRQREIELHQHFNWAPYWGGGVMGPIAPPEPSRAQLQEAAAEAGVGVAEAQSHLRSTNEVRGYHIHATDGSIGHVDDFIAGDTDWVIRYLVVDTRNWLPGRHVLISPQWVEKISWVDREVFVDVTKEKVEDSPEYDPTTPVNQEYEVRLYDYYGRPRYWG